MLPNLLSAQSSGKTFHLYVDPIHGDDTCAATENPHPSKPNFYWPLQQHPSVPTNITGQLQHAPYAYRTLSAAVAWVTSFPPLMSGGFLPWTNSHTGGVVNHVVIHCMPGLYGPRSANAPGNDDEFDPASGLPWNDEHFPIRLPGNVSIQGTSALDTIFDARGYLEPGNGLEILDIDALQYQEPASNFDHSFIDAVSLRGCRFTEGNTGAAIRIHGSRGVKFSVTNCFVYGNDVGIVIHDQPGPNEPHQAPRIVCNTIAWNQIGIWSGNGNFESTGSGIPVILDNLFDPIRPTIGVPIYLTRVGLGTTEPPTCFQGLDNSDLLTTEVTTGCGIQHNYNAYHDGYRNNIPQTITWPYGPTSPRTANPLTPPIVVLDPILGPWGTLLRGDLFIADVFRTHGHLCSPHDLRLAPMTRRSGGGITDPSAFSLNPVVNQGIGSHGGISSANGSQIVANEPGLPDDDLAKFNAWDWDCEGVGNPRESPRRIDQSSHFSEPWWPCAGRIDLGADELGELIVSGYLDSTRIFSRPHPLIAPNTGSIDVCDKLYYFNCNTPGTATTTFIGPEFNARSDDAAFIPAVPGGAPQWFAQLGPWHNPFQISHVAPYAYTDGQHTGSYPTQRACLTTTSFGIPPVPWTSGDIYPVFMRSRVCDIGPHLADVINPNINPRDVDYATYQFQLFPGVPTNPINDIFQANPWCRASINAVAPAVNDNRFLFVDPPSSKHLNVGTLSPPPVVVNDPIQISFPKSFLYRDTTYPIGYWEPSPYTYTVGIQGISGPRTVPYLPNGRDWYGLRINMELFIPDDPGWQFLGDPTNNIQTFLVVQAHPPAMNAGTGSDPSELSFGTAAERDRSRLTIEVRMSELGGSRR